MADENGSEFALPVDRMSQHGDSDGFRQFARPYDGASGAVAFSGLAWDRSPASLLLENPRSTFADVGEDDARRIVSELQADLPRHLARGLTFDGLIDALQQAVGVRDEMLFAPKAHGEHSVYRISTSPSGSVVVVVVDQTSDGGGRVTELVDQTLLRHRTINVTADRNGEMYEVFGATEELIGWSRTDLLSGSISLPNLFDPVERDGVSQVLLDGGAISTVLLSLHGGRVRARVAVDVNGDEGRHVVITVGPDALPYPHIDPLSGSLAAGRDDHESSRQIRVVLTGIVNLDRCLQLYNDDAIRSLWTKLVRSLESIEGSTVRIGAFGEIITTAPLDKTDLAREVMNSYRTGGVSPFRFATSEATGPGNQALLAARRSLRQARRSGRSYLFAEEEAGVERDDRILAELSRALERGEPALHLQPIVEASTGLVTSAEALFRWTSPTLGFVSPGELMPLLVGSTLQGQLDRWAINTAAGIAQRVQQVRPVRIWVNISPALLDTGLLLSTLSRAVTGLPPGSFGIEVTEHEAISDINSHALQLQAVRDIGVHVGLDDFGTGSSSLSYASGLPCDELKIDGSFVRGLPDGKQAASVCRAITSLGVGLGVSVCAEMVETRDQALMLRMLGVDLLQGWLFSKALPVDQLLELLDRGGIIE